MMGGVFHEMTLDRLEAASRQPGLRVSRSVPCGKPDGSGYRYIDLLIGSNETEDQLLIEVEMDSPKRVAGDLEKRRALGPMAMLWIVVPTGRLADLVERRLRDLGARKNEPVWVPVFSAALRQLEDKNPFWFPGVPEQKSRRNTNP